MDGQASPAVEEANRRLYEMRERLAAGRAGVDDASHSDERSTPPMVTGNPASTGEPPPNWPLRNAQMELLRNRAATGGGAYGERARMDWPRPPATANAVTAVEAAGCRVPGAPPSSPTSITVHPTMLHAILRRELAGPARVWLLLRVIDARGSGRLAVEDARRELTAAGAALWLCGWRRLRQLLAEGEGVFWTRDERGRLWLRGAHRVAGELGCGRLQGYPVELPLAVLLGGIQGVRAAFYAAFHAGRAAKPISRATLAALSGVPERTQLAYDRAARVARARNVAVGERYSAATAQERAWGHGRAAFHFIDSDGKQGRPGGEYVAWHLPNSYCAGYRRRGRGSRKRLNRKIADLVTKGIPGNDERAVERVFFGDGARAARAYNRNPARDAYWRREGDTRSGDGLWGVIAAAPAGMWAGRVRSGVAAVAGEGERGVAVGTGRGNAVVAVAGELSTVARSGVAVPGVTLPGGMNPAAVSQNRLKPVGGGGKGCTR